MKINPYAETVRLHPDAEDPISVEDRLLAVIAKIARLTDGINVGTCLTVNRLVHKTLEKYGHDLDR